MNIEQARYKLDKYNYKFSINNKDIRSEEHTSELQSH